MDKQIKIHQPDEIIPFWAGIFMTWQILMLTINATSHITFKGWGAIVWLPSHIMFVGVIIFFYNVRRRSLLETRNKLKGKHEDNEMPKMTNEYAQFENERNESWMLKFMLPWEILAILANVKMDIKKEHISWWIVGGPAIAYTLFLSIEGLQANKFWFKDARQDTREMIEEALEDGLNFT